MQEYFPSQTWYLLYRFILVCHSSLCDGALRVGCLACVLLCCYAALPPSWGGGGVARLPRTTLLLSVALPARRGLPGLFAGACLGAKRFCQSGAAQSVLLYVTLPGCLVCMMLVCCCSVLPLEVSQSVCCLADMQCRQSGVTWPVWCFLSRLFY